MKFNFAGGDAGWFSLSNDGEWICRGGEQWMTKEEFIRFITEFLKYETVQQMSELTPRQVLKLYATINDL